VSDLTKLANQWNAKKKECRIVIETPKGRRSKFDYDPDTGLFELAGLLPEGLAFPFDFGFVPSTLADDGDPADVMVFMDEPSHVGCLVNVRLIGVIEAEQVDGGKKETNDRLVAAAVHSYAHENVTSLDEVNPTILNQVEEFFVTYNRERGKKFKVKGRHGPKRAEAVMDQTMKAFKKKRG
jgi:inorganic pyrophosphatase